MTKESKFPYGLGRRKTAVAQVQLRAGDKETQKINGLDLPKYFDSAALANTARQALELTSQDDVFGLQAKVHGGGKRAQAEAVRMACARALLEVDAGFRKQLKEAGMLKRDPRMKERKKFGLKGARRAPQFSKR